MANFLDPVDQEELDYQSKIPSFNLADLNKRSSQRDDELNSILSQAANPQQAAPAMAPEAPVVTNDTLVSAPEPKQNDASEISKLLGYLKPTETNLPMQGQSFAQGGDELDKAIKARDEEIKANRIGAAGQTIADAIAPGTSKIGNEFYDQGVKLADRKVEDYKRKIENQKVDPNSEYSAGLRNFAQRFGVTVPENVSGETMEKLLPYVTRAYDSELDNKARVLSMVESRKARTGDKTDQEKEKLTDRLRAEVDRNTKKTVDQYETKQQFNDLLQDYLQNYDKYGSRGFQDLALRYGFIKSRDDTAVREGELKILQSAGSIPAKLKRALSQAISGKSLTKADLQELNKLNQTEMSALQQKFQKGVAAQVNRAKSKGLDLEQIISRQDILNAKQQEKAPVGKDPKIDSWAKEHGLTYDKAESILKARGYNGGK